MNDMGGKRTGYFIVDCSKLDTVSKRMLCVSGKKRKCLYQHF